jgi:hypothetical protein
VTYRATRLDDGRVVCIKELLYRRMGAFKEEELFRREASILRQLRHPAIPEYFGDFTQGEGKTFGLYLVQEFVAGRTLAQEMETRRYSERDVLVLMTELLEILDYLHTLSPPVVHRDLKPGNIMRRTVDGKLLLVDFGSVKDTLRESTVGSTVAGTLGYMAPEQLYGKALPASDLYALGMVALVLLSRRRPEEMVDSEQRLEWRPHVAVHPATGALLEALLEPDPDRRPQRAAEALERVRAVLTELSARRPPPPAREVEPVEMKPARPVLLVTAAGLALVLGALIVAYQVTDRTRRTVEKPGPVPQVEVRRPRTVVAEPVRPEELTGERTPYCTNRTVMVRDRVLDLARTVFSARAGCVATFAGCTFKTTASKSSPFWVATLEAGDDGRIEILGGRIEGTRYAVSASGRSRVVLQKVTVRGLPTPAELSHAFGRSALKASDDARVIVLGGEVSDTDTAIIVEGRAVVVLAGVRVSGEIIERRGGKALILKAGESAEKALLELDARRQQAQARLGEYARVACTGVPECYVREGVSGHVVGRIDMRTGKSGKVSRVAVRLPGAPAAVADCLRKLSKAKAIPDFKGPKGKLVCEYSGSVGGGGEGIKWTSRYEPSDPSWAN